MTTETFAEYVAQQDARNTIQLNVHKWTLMLCDALVDNFKQSHPNSDPYTFSVESGRKYHKIVNQSITQHQSPLMNIQLNGVAGILLSNVFCEGLGGHGWFP